MAFIRVFCSLSISSVYSFIFHCPLVFSNKSFFFFFLTELCRFRTILGSLLMFCHLKTWWIKKNRRYYLCILVCLKALPPFELMTRNLLSLTDFICLSNIQRCTLCDAASVMLSLPICFAFLGLAPCETQPLRVPFICTET